MPPELLWSGGLTAGLGIVGWLLRTYVCEVQRIQILLNRTREELSLIHI